MHFVCISHFKITNVASGEAQKKEKIHYYCLPGYETREMYRISPKGFLH